MTEKYKRYDKRSNYSDYTRERDAHLYELWKQARDKDWIADYIGRSRERGRQLAKKFEAMARMEEESAQRQPGQHRDRHSG